MLQTNVIENIKAHILCTVTFFKKNCAVYEIMWKNIVQQFRPQMAMCRMHIACRIHKATSTHIHRLCNAHCLSTATMVERRRLCVTLFVHYIACLVKTHIHFIILLCAFVCEDKYLFCFFEDT